MAVPPLHPEYKIGDKVEDFSLINTVDNKTVNLSDYSNEKAVVIIFASFSCPYSKIYEPRILNLVHTFDEQDVAFIFINSHVSAPEDQITAMAQWAKEKVNSYPYLTDPRKKVATLFAATKTPEVFVLKNMKGNFILQYRGAIDDNPQDAKEVTTEYLKEAIIAVINDKALKVSEKRAIGCIIR